MSGFHLQLQAHDPELAGAPVVVSILDGRLHLVGREAVTIGDQHYFEVPAGRYGIQALLPSGQSLTESVTVDEGTPLPHVMDLSEISPHGFLRRTVVLKSAAFETPRSLYELAYRSLWVRLWARNQGSWSVGQWPQPETSRDSDAVRYWFQTGQQQYMLQIGGPQIPWRMVSLPAARRLEVTIRPSASLDEPELTVTVATDNNLAEAMLGYLTLGALGHAEQLVNEQAEALLFGKAADPAAAAVGGYYLLRITDLQRLHNWPQNLANWMRWMPDGAVIHAWQLIREQQEAQIPSEEAFSVSRGRLLEAVERGTPVYTEGLRLLVAGLKLLDFEAEGGDREVRDALDRVRPFAAAADLGQPTTTFTGSSPFSPSTTPTYGLPGSLTGLAFLYDIQQVRQDRIEYAVQAATPTEIRYAPGTWSAGDIQREIDSFWDPLANDDELRQEVRDAGIDISELAGLDRRNAIAVSAGAAGFAPASVALVVAFAPTANAIVARLWETVLLPRIRRRYGQDAIGLEASRR